VKRVRRGFMADHHNQYPRDVPKTPLLRV
jgi:hypothetical protein